MNTVISKAEVKDIITKYYAEDFVKLSDLKLCLPVKDVQIRDDDIFLLGYQKSGTTWLQELVWLIGNNLNYEGAKDFIDERFPVLEIEIYMQAEPNQDNTYSQILECHQDSFNFVNKLKSPRFIKSHVAPEYLPTQLLSGETQAKIIYISRNVKDVCLSYYHYSKNILKFHNASLDDFCKVFMGFESIYWRSVLHFWNLRNEKNVLFIRYEEMKTNLGEVIKKVAKFLNKVITKEEEENLSKWLHFDTMKANDAVNHNSIYKDGGFIRTGKIGGYREEMSPATMSLFEAWIEESIKNSDYVDYN